MFDRTEKKQFSEVNITEKAAKIVKGDKYAFIYAHRWLNPETLNWRIVNAPNEISFNTVATMISNYDDNISENKKVI